MQLNLSRLNFFSSFWKIAALLFLMSGSIVLLHAINPAFFDSIMEKVHQHQALLCIIRWTILLIFITAWPYIILKTGHQQKVSGEKILYWQKEIWRIGIWLIIFELLICQNLISKTIHLLGM